MKNKLQARPRKAHARARSSQIPNSRSRPEIVYAKRGRRALCAPAVSPPPPDLDRHERKCTICHHPDRDAIDADFVRWRSPRHIVEEYGIADHSTIYRHAHATGLFAVRKRNLRLVLEHFLEQTEHVFIKADSIIRAARVYARINDSGEWTEPPSTHIVVPALSEAPENMGGSSEISSQLASSREPERT